MTNYLSTLIASFSAESISNAFIYAIVILMILSVLLAYKGKARRFTSNTTNLLTSLGILGTFAGIVVGLMEFNPTDIDGSIEALLAGLKTAFLTSLVGMAGSIMYKGIVGLIPEKEEIAAQAIGPEDIFTVMSKQLAASTELLSAIKGDEDSSLTSQIKMLRTDISDANKSQTAYQDLQLSKGETFQTQLWKKMDEFGEVLSKSATEQVINALKEVIVEFNEKLTEQFGENFKRLDESVKKLVDWQENYRHQLEDMANKYQLGVDAISSTEKSVASINKRAESIPATMEKLHQVMELGHGQVTELEHRLETFKDLRDKAVEAMPQIQTHLESTITEIESSVKHASTHYSEMLEQSSKVIAEYTKATSEGADNIKQKLTEGADDLGNKLSSSANEIGGKLVEASQVFESNAGEASSKMKAMNNELTTAAEQIGQELNKSMSELNNMMRTLVTGIKEDAEQTSKTLENANLQLVSDTKAMREESTQAIQEMKSRLEGALAEVFQSQSKEVSRTFESIENHLKKTLKESGAAMDTQFSAFDKQMEEEVQRIVQAMGTNLATVTNKFTQDYTQLTLEMSKVVRSAQGTF